MAVATKKKQTHITVRFETKAQVERMKKAAALRGWSFNQYVVWAADKLSVIPEKPAASAELVVND